MTFSTISSPYGVAQLVEHRSSNLKFAGSLMNQMVVDQLQLEKK